MPPRIPFDAVKVGLKRAQLRIVQPAGLSDEDAIVPVRFNPTQYQLEKQNTFADINIPGLETPPIQYVRGSAERLSTELLVDTSDTLEDVQKRYVDKLRGLMNIQSELHAPPIVDLEWGSNKFRGVMESLTVSYTLFAPDGTPLRAKLDVKLKAYRPVEIQVKERPKLSPDFEKSYTVQRGDTLTGIAHKLFRNPSFWRRIARANGIRDPRRIEPGHVLRIPRLR